MNLIKLFFKKIVFYWAAAILEWLPFIVFILLGMMFLLYVFNEYEQPGAELIKVSNYGFAFLVGLASVVFSWARALDGTTQANKVRRLNGAAADCVFASILFLIASFCSYYYPLIKDPDLGPWAFSFRFGKIASLVLAGILAMLSMFRITDTYLILLTSSYAIPAEIKPKRWEHYQE